VSCRPSSFGDTGQTTTAGVTRQMRYTGFGGMRAMTDGNGETTTYGLDGLNRTRQISDAENGVRQLSYDGAGNLAGQTDPRGVATAMRYDHLGRRTERKTGSIVDERIVYNDLARTVSRTDARNKTTVTSFDELGRVTNVSRPDNTSVSYTWDGEYMRTATDGRGKVTAYDYDSIGRVTKVTDPENRITLVDYTDAPGVSRRTVADRRGFMHVDEFDALGRLAKRIVDGETVAQFEYDGVGNRTAELDGRGNRTEREYDALGRVHRVLHPGNRIERWDYDAAGNVLRYNTGAGNDVVMTYDRANRMITRTDASGMLARFRYDLAGLMTEKRERRDAYGLAEATANFEQVKAFTHNAYGKTATVAVGQDLDGTEGGTQASFHGMWTYGYDAAQNLASVTDAMGRTTTYGWDALNRIERIRRPGGREWTIGYDADGRVANRVDAKGQASEFDYTDAGYVDAMRVRAAGGALERVADYTTDPEGNATEIAEQVGGVSAVRNRTFDARGRMRSETDGAGNRVAWTLDTAGNVTRLDVEAGASAWAVGYGYDGQNRVTTVTDQTAGSRLLASYVWRGDDQMASVTYGNGAVRLYGYDSGNRLTSVENTWTGGSERFDYGYDVGSNRKTEERRVDGQLVRSVAYKHDVEDRLTEAAYTTPAAGGNPAVTRAVTWGYDLVGNRTREVGTDPATGAAIDRTTVYNDRNEPVTMADAADAAANATYGHDANGNLTTVLRGGIETRYAYDGRDQMVRASRVEGGVETVVGEYGYDAERRRTQSVAGGVTKRSVWAGQSVAAEVAGGTAVSRYDSGTDLIRTELAGEGERWYGRDAMGTTTSLTSATGAVTARAEYDAWGERIAESGATANRVGFTGYREDAETGLDYAINRYYSPDTGRFTTHDPLTELDRPDRLTQPQGLNLYPYVMGAPTRYVDPDGLEWGWNPNSGDIQWFGSAAEIANKGGWIHLVRNETLLLRSDGTSRLFDGTFDIERGELEGITVRLDETVNRMDPIAPTHIYRGWKAKEVTYTNGAAFAAGAINSLTAADQLMHLWLRGEGPAYAQTLQEARDCKPGVFFIGELTGVVISEGAIAFSPAGVRLVNTSTSIRESDKLIAAGRSIQETVARNADITTVFGGDLRSSTSSAMPVVDQVATSQLVRLTAEEAGTMTRNASEHVGTGLGKSNLINPAGKTDNCVGCVAAVVRNKNAGEFVGSADDVALTFGPVGREAQLDVAASLKYIQESTGLEASARPVGFSNVEAEVGHYAIFVRRPGAGGSPYHVLYGRVLPNGRRFIYDPQNAGATMWSWPEMVQKYGPGIAYILK